MTRIATYFPHNVEFALEFDEARMEITMTAVQGHLCLQTVSLPANPRRLARIGHKLTGIALRIDSAAENAREDAANATKAAKPKATRDLKAVKPEPVAHSSAVDALKTMVKARGRQFALDLVKSFGLHSFADIRPDQYAAFKAACEGSVATPITYESAAAAVTALCKVKGRPAAVALLAKFGAASLPSAKPEQYSAIKAAAELGLSK